jgi:hypothetical protein
MPVKFNELDLEIIFFKVTDILFGQMRPDEIEPDPFLILSFAKLFYLDQVRF